MFIRRLSSFFGLFIIFLTIFLIIWIIWLPGIRVAADYHFWFEEELKILFNVPYLWRNFLGADGMGQNVVTTAWTWPSIIFYSVLTMLGFSFSLITKVVIALLIILGVIGIDKLYRRNVV